MPYVVGSLEWLEERRTYLGASEMPAALGLSPWDDPISVWEQKTDPIAPVKPESFRMKLGTLVEPIIGRLASEQLGVRLVHPSGPIRHVSAPYLASNPDFRILGHWHDFRTGRGLVQAKLSLEETFGEPDDGEGRGIPLHYRLQGLGELLTTSFDYVYFAALDPRHGVSLYPLDRRMGDNEAAITDLFSDCVDWWQEYVIPKRVPPPSSQSAEALRRRYPEAKLKVGKIASAEQSQTLDELLRMRDSAKAIGEELDGLKNTAKSWIGDAQYIEGAGKRFSWSRFDLTKIEWELIAKAYRTVLDGAVVNTTGRTWNGSWRIDKMPDLDTIEKLYTRTEPSDRLTISDVK